jgi:isopenicillin N synthase-like dioxygenase
MKIPILLIWFNVLCDSSIAKSSIVSSVLGTIPVINIEAWTRKNRTSSESFEIANAVNRACSEIGFFVVKGHSISQETIRKMWTASAEFFDLALDEKLAMKSSNISAYPYGYEHTERLQLGMDGKVENGLPDSKETFSLGPSDPKSGMPSRQFPIKPVGFQESMEQYYIEMENLSLTLLSIFAVALGLPEDWFLEKMNHHMSALRILNYFPLKLDSASPGSVRASPHTDYGALTILKSGGPGLQVKKGGSESDVWIDVPDLSDVFIINIGDMMQRWTNGKLIVFAK